MQGTPSLGPREEPSHLVLWLSDALGMVGIKKRIGSKKQSLIQKWSTIFWEFWNQMIKKKEKERRRELNSFCHYVWRQKKGWRGWEDNYGLLIFKGEAFKISIVRLFLTLRRFGRFVRECCCYSETAPRLSFWVTMERVTRCIASAAAL